MMAAEATVAETVVFRLKTFNFNKYRAWNLKDVYEYDSNSDSASTVRQTSNPRHSMSFSK